MELAKGDITHGGAFGSHFGEGEVVSGQRWYYSKEQRWFPIGSPLRPLHYCWTSHLPGLLRLLYLFHHRPRRAKSLVSNRLTGAMVPPKFHLRILLHARPSFRQLPRGRGLGSVRSFSETKTSLTIRLELHCPGEGFSWPSLSLD